MGPCCPGDGEHLPAHERGRLIPCFALLAGLAFALSIKPSLSQPMNFFNFAALILFLFPPERSEGVAVGA